MIRKVSFYSNICNKDSPNYSTVSLVLLCLFLSLSKLLYRFWFSRTEWLVLVRVVLSDVVTRFTFLILSSILTHSCVLVRFLPMIRSFLLVLSLLMTRSFYMVLIFVFDSLGSIGSLFFFDSFVRVGSI